MPGWCIVIGVLTFGHPLPDEHVERAVQVTAYPDRIEIRYFIGINDNTVAEQLRRMQPAAASSAESEAALSEYAKRIFPKMADHIAVSLDGKGQTVKPEKWSPVYKHHVQLECVYHISVGAHETPRRLEIVDKNFRETPGAHRMAIKGREGAFVLDASAPPILARVERIPWSEMTKEQKNAATRIDGSLINPTPVKQ